MSPRFPSDVPHRIVMLDTTVRVVTDSDRTVSLDFTDLDLSGYVPANAVIAIIKPLVRLDAYGHESNWCFIDARKNGVAPAHRPELFALWEPSSAYYNTGLWFVGMDANKVIEYRIYVYGELVQVDTWLDLLGYVEEL